MTSAWFRRRWPAAGLVAVGIAGALCPVPAAAARTDAACARPQRYVAEANAELLRVKRLDLRPAGRSEEPVTDVGVATAGSALVAESPIASAAAARLLDGQPAEPRAGRTSAASVAASSASAALAKPVYQQAPPSNSQAGRTDTGAQRVGPLTLQRGRLTTHARWHAPMACGDGSGEVTRAQVSADGVTVLTGTDGRSLVSVPRGLQSLSTTALERRGANVHTVARASVSTREIRLFGDAVRVIVVRDPHLTTSISANDGSAEVRYFPPTLEVSGGGFAPRRLQAPGDHVEIALPRRGARTESAPAIAGDVLGSLLKTVGPGALAGLVSGGAAATPLLPGLPERPGLPPIPGRTPGSAEAVSSSGGTTEMVRIWIGDVRQASSGHAVAARAVSVRVEVLAGASATGRGGVVLDLDLGVLEAAAVAPDNGTAGGAGIPVSARTDAGGRLPVTGAAVDLPVLAGGALLVSGTAFLWYGLRRRNHG